MKLQQTKSGQLFLNLSKPIARANNWQKGDNLELYLNRQGEWCIRKNNPIN